MYALKVISHFAAAHRLRHYKGKCETLHGHNWQVEVEVKTTKLDAAGMVMDFQQLKAILNECLARWDHTYLNEVPPFDKDNPTSEKIAFYIFQEIKNVLPKNVLLSRVRVWESNTACAEYFEDGTCKD